MSDPFFASGASSINSTNQIRAEKDDYSNICNQRDLKSSLPARNRSVYDGCITGQVGDSNAVSCKNILSFKSSERGIYTARICSHIMQNYLVSMSNASNNYVINEVTSHWSESAEAIASIIQALVPSILLLIDPCFQKHQRLQQYVKTLANQLSGKEKYKESLSLCNVDLLSKLVPLYNVGIACISNEIINKTQSLTSNESSLLKTYPLLGLDLFEEIESHLGFNLGFFRLAKEIISSHRELWDGSGYPFGLSGEFIPITARILAVAEAYDIATFRCLRGQSLTHDSALDVLIERSGSMYDPEVIHAFIEVEDEIRYFSENLNSCLQGASKSLLSNEIIFKPELLLKDVKIKLDSLPVESLPYILAILSESSYAFNPITDVVLPLLADDAPITFGPTHRTLVELYDLRHGSNYIATEEHLDKLDIFKACHNSRAANVALRFLSDLPAFMPTSALNQRLR